MVTTFQFLAGFLILASGALLLRKTRRAKLLPLLRVKR
jgi:LPXTG-motif cell wall-anchored protein